MKFFLSAFLLHLLCFCAAAQSRKDSLFLTLKDGRAFVRHQVRKGETLFGLAQQYNVPAIVLAQNNDLSFHDVPVAGKPLLVPLGNYNFLQHDPPANSKTTPLYYRVQAGDDWAQLSAAMDVNEAFLRSRNPGQIIPGKVLLSGWLQYEAPVSTTMSADEVPSAAPVAVLAPGAVVPSAATAKKDTARPAPSEHELMYNYQTNDGATLDSSEGMVVFFQAQTTVSQGQLYAFSNDVPKGKVVKILNPSNGKFAFARILGPIPGTKQYHNAKIGVDNRARKELGIRDTKLWCKLYYNF
jgi:hypothetical protein